MGKLKNCRLRLRLVAFVLVVTSTFSNMARFPDMFGNWISSKQSTNASVVGSLSMPEVSEGTVEKEEPQNHLGDEGIEGSLYNDTDTAQIRADALPAANNAPIKSATEDTIEQPIDTKSDNKVSVSHSDTANPPLQIFLNTFIPLIGQEKRVGQSWDVTERRSLAILSEQIEQIARSTTGQNQNISVHITTVARDSVNATALDELCSSASNGTVNCRKALHVNVGGEIDTLSLLHEYCQSAPDTAKATYIHNKGSFHPGRENDRWRRAMTAAVVHKDCVAPPNDSCNLCGLNFAAPPTMFTVLMPGNFFTASCGYVKKLWHPKEEYEHRQAELLQTVQNRMNKKRFTATKFGFKPWSVGRNRYTPEHWIGSHPDIVPCDMGVHENYWYWGKKEHYPDTDFRWSMAPRALFNGTDTMTTNVNHTELTDRPDLRLQDYGLLAGLLYRWSYLYNATPGVGSWIWSWAPDGNYWKNSIEMYGVDAAVDIVTNSTFDRNESMSKFLLEGSL